MEKTIIVILSDPIKLAYGNPLNLKQGEKRVVPITPTILDLLRNGALVSSNIGSKQKTPLKNNNKAGTKKVGVSKQNNPNQNTAKQPTNTAKPHQNNKIQFNIKGVGIETLKDINKIYNNEKELQDAIKANKVPLRNDVVKKIKDYYKKLIK